MTDAPPTLVFTVREKDDRLDRALRTLHPEFSRSRWRDLIRSKCVVLNGECVEDADTPVVPGDQLVCTLPSPTPLDLAPEEIPLSVLFEDDSLLVLDKPAGLCVHPAPGHDSGTLVNALLNHCGSALPGINGVSRPGIVHRLDKDTSGLLVVAKTERAQVALVAQFSAHSVLKEYLALAKGVVTPARGTVDKPIGRHPTDRKRMAVVPTGRTAVSRYVCLASVPEVSLVRVRIETGRTHQIRVHLASIGHPVVGDSTYSRPSPPLPACVRQMLHAAHIRFLHPLSGDAMEFFCPPPADFLDCAQALNLPAIPAPSDAFAAWMAAQPAP